LAGHVPHRPLRRSAKSRPGHPASQLLGMVNTDSLHPILESCSDGEESCGKFSFISMTTMPCTYNPLGKMLRFSCGATKQLILHILVFSIPVEFNMA
jgi:hypothetical protein